MKALIASLVAEALNRARAAGELRSEPPRQITVEAPKEREHGDASTNVALAMARSEGKSPQAIAIIVKRHIEPRPDTVAEVSVAGPGFINFRMTSTYWYAELRRAAREGKRFWHPQLGDGRKVQVEFLSANPTGPLTVGHGRNAVLGDTIARFCEATGSRVTREYYFNNGGRQMKLLGESVRARYLQELGRDAALPEEGYQGEYILEVARALVAEHGSRLADEKDLEVFRAAAERAIFADILQTCRELGIRFDVFTNELDLMREGLVERALAALAERGLTAERDGALWLRADALNLPKDRVLVRSGEAGGAEAAEAVYRATDIAYHIDKLERGFDLVVDVFGADHIAEHQDVTAALGALGYDISKIRTIIYQFVTLTRGGQKVKMSTRKATYVTLDELIEEVGVDAVRFLFLLRKHSSHLDFDLDLAKRQAPENPVFYVQYAHARLASVFREAAKAGLELPAEASAIMLERLCEEELELAKLIVGLVAVVEESVSELEPHRIPFYLLEMAGTFHRYYNKPANRIIGKDRELSVARLFLAGLLKDAIACGLELLGVTAPDRM